MTKPRRGFLLGKFLPPHLGHVFLCRSAAAMVDELTVLVCSIDSEPIPGRLRHEWMRDLLPGMTLLHMHRDIPQAPEDHPEFWTIWRETLKEIHPEAIDRVFGSEPYIFRLATELGAEPILIDPKRESFPVSGIDIRNDPAANWRFIPPVVRPYFQKRICLLGPESTGKSTMARNLASHFDTQYMPEYGRTYDDYYRQGQNWVAADFLTLAETHIAMRQALAPNAGPLLIEDTDPIQTAVWAEYLLGAMPAELGGLLADYAAADLYLLLSPDVRWLNDGTRYSGNEKTRTWFFEKCRSHLQGLGLRYNEISDTGWGLRSAATIGVIEDFTREKPTP